MKHRELKMLFFVLLGLALSATGAYFNRGIAYERMGKREEASNDFTKAIELNPEDAGAYFYRGVTSERLGEFERAIVDYTRAMELNPRNADYYYIRGNAYHRLKLKELAEKDYEGSVTLNPEYVASPYAYDEGNRLLESELYFTETVKVKKPFLHGELIDLRNKQKYFNKHLNVPSFLKNELCVLIFNRRLYGT